MDCSKSSGIEEDVEKEEEAGFAAGVDVVAFFDHRASPFGARLFHYDRKCSPGVTQIVLQGMKGVMLPMCSREPLWLSAVELFEDAKRNKHVLPSGCEGIDFLLGGGLREGQLTEIVGSSSSGKTQVCLHSALSVARTHLGSVLLLDTCNSFSPNRIASIFNQQTGMLVKEGEESMLKGILSSILCQSVFDIFELLDVLHQLECQLKHLVKSGGNGGRLLIIDSISSLITPILGGKNSRGRLLMISTGILLKKIANEYNLSVLVTNHMVGGEGGNLKPALGESWRSIPHVRLLLSRDPGSNICNVSVLKHTIIASGRTAKFVIHN